MIGGDKNNDRVLIKEIEVLDLIRNDVYSVDSVYRGLATVCN